MKPKIEIITDENGKAIGQRRYNVDTSQETRLLDCNGEFDEWAQEKTNQGNLYGTSEQFDAELKAAEKHFTRQHPKPEEFSPEMAADMMRDKEEDWDAKIAAQELSDEVCEEMDMHLPGAKDDASKQLAALVLGGFSGALQEVIKVGTFGAEKYSPNGWMHVPNAHDRYANAAMRHWLKTMDGNTFNHEDGNVRHLAQVAWNILAVLEFELAEEQIHQVGSK